MQGALVPELLRGRLCIQDVQWARLITSDSVVDLEVEVCLLLSQARGKLVLGPFKTRYPPEVLRAPSFSPAKSASAKRLRYKSSGLSFTWPTKRKCLVESMYWMSLRTFLSSTLVQDWTLVARSLIGLMMSGHAVDSFGSASPRRQARLLTSKLLLDRLR